MNNYALFGSLSATTGNQVRLIEILTNAAELLAKETDCIQYSVSTSSDPNKVFVYEVWPSKESHTAALQNQNVRNLIAQAMPILSGNGDKYELTTRN